MDGPLLIRGEREIALDHQALGDGGIPAEPELRRDRTLVDMAAARERRLLAMSGDRAPGNRVVLESAPHEAGSDDGLPVVRKAGRAGVGELDHLRQLLAPL